MAWFGRRRAERHPARAPADHDVVEATDSALDPQAAVAASQRLLRSVPVGANDERGRLAVIGQFAVELEQSFSRTGAPEGLGVAIELGRALAARCVGWPEEAEIRSNLASALLTRFQAARAPADLDEAFGQASAAVTASPPGHPDRARSLSNLSYALRMRSDRNDSADDLDLSIHALREALHATDPTDPDRSGRLTNLGATLHMRFRRSGSHDDLDESIETSRAAGRIVGAAGRFDAITNLWSALVDRVQVDGRLEDLDECVEVGRERARLMTTRPSGGPPASQRALFLSLHATMFLSLHAAMLRVRLTELLRLRAAPPAAASDSARNRRDRLDARADRTGDLASLDDAIQVATEIVDRADGNPSDPRRWSDHGVLADLLRRRYELTRDVDELGRAIALWRAALGGAPDEHPGRIPWQGNLALALRIRAESTGDIRDLHAAIPLQQAVVEAQPADLRAPDLMGLATMLQDRYQHGGPPADLDRALELGRAALAASAADDRGSVFNNLAHILLQDYERTSAPATLAEAIHMFRSAVSVTPAAHRRLASRRSALGAALLMQVDLTSNAAALDEAIVLLRSAVDEASADNAMYRPQQLANLADALWRRHKLASDAEHRAGDVQASGQQGGGRGDDGPPANGAAGREPVADLDEAAQLWERALEMLSYEDPRRLRLLIDLTEARAARNRLFDGPDTRTGAATGGPVTSGSAAAGAATASASGQPAAADDEAAPRLLTDGLVRTDVHEAWVDLTRSEARQKLTAYIEESARTAAQYRANRDYRGAIISEQNRDFLLRAAQVGGPAAAKEALRRADLTVLRAAASAFYGTRNPDIERLLLTAFPYLPRIKVVRKDGGPTDGPDLASVLGTGEESAWLAAKTAAFEAHAALGVVTVTDDALWRTGAAVALALEREYERRDESRPVAEGPPAADLSEPLPVEVGFALAIAALTVLPLTVTEDDLRILLTLAANLAHRLHAQIGAAPAGERSAAWPSGRVREDSDHLGAIIDWKAILGERLLTVELAEAQRVEVLRNLAVTLGERHAHDGHTADLDRLIDVFAELAERTPTDDTEHLRWDFQLADQRELRYPDTGQAADLDGAVDGYRRVFDALPADDELHPAVRGRLRDARLQRFRASRQIADIDAVVALSEAAAGAEAMERAADPDQVWRQVDLAEALRERHDLTRQVADIDRAVALGREALSAVAAGAPLHAELSSQLALSLRGRFLENGVAGDIDEAVELGRAAAAATSAADPDHYGYLVALADLLVLRVGAVGPPEVAAWVREQTADETAEQRRRTEGVLGRWFRTDVDRDGDLATAIGLYRRALAAVHTGDRDNARIFGALGVALRTRHTLAASSTATDVDMASDTDTALDALISAARLAGPGDPERTAILHNLGMEWRRRAERSGSPADLAAAAENLRAAATNPAGPAHVRLRAAEEWGLAAVAAGDLAAGVDAYASALARLHEVAWQGRDRPHQERELSSRARLARDAAAVALDAGQPERAVELLELGRSVLWTQLLDLRGDDSRLAAAAPALHTELGQVRAALDGEAEVTAAERIALAQRWDTLVAQVRTLPGFTNFLRPVPLERLRRAAVNGTVVIVNLSDVRCDALLVRPDGVRAVPLPELSADEVGARAASYLGALRTTEQARQAQQAAWSAVPSPAAATPPATVTAAVQAAQRAERELLRAERATEDAITATLEWLWDAVAETVLTALGHLDAPAGDAPWPRVWWCPTGPLALLPLHAAGHHRDTSGSPARTVLDRVVSSYTPTLRALLAARDPGGPDDSGAPDDPGSADDFGQLLAVAMPDTPGQPPLAGVDDELAVLGEHFGDDHVTVLRAGAATRHAVRAALGSHSWVHFSCHGTQDLADPSSGGLALHDGVMTVVDVARLRRRGEFAALSACKTATGGVELADETITLAAALHHAGWRHVVGTLWSVYDGSATTAVFRAVYGEVTAGGAPRTDGIAGALRRAVVALRDNHRGEPSVWTPFTHTGP
ncbi:CHAT domain-containing protein [Frankia tisae]|uniref:CHAT domain-containing protein n=1 Tax=Frankia tisae TaxID=2950104 RepID=UPI0021C09AA3|nr:CHAT domain-containing protein [Frankia tisae]